MKFLHLGDLHLGKPLMDYSLREDQEYILDQIVDVAEKEKVSAILIAGDIYDRADPSEEAVRLLDRFLRTLVSKQIKVFIISGNHDSDDRLEFGSSLFETNGIYISAKFNGKLYQRTLEENGEKVNICLLPFVKASQVRHYYPDAVIRNYEDAVRAVLESAEINENETNILVAHQFVTGKSSVSLAGSEGTTVKNVGLVEQISASCFDRFDYVALGHIHAPQELGRETLRYAGSPIKYSLSEINNDKSMPLLTVENGKVSVELIPLKPKRDMRHLKGKMEQLLAKDVVEKTEDFIYVTLTEEDIIPDAMGIFRAFYPNMLHIDYENSHTKVLDQDPVQIVENKSFDELFRDFYRLIYQQEISEEEMAVMRDVAGKAGVIHETE